MVYEDDKLEKERMWPKEEKKEGEPATNLLVYKKNGLTERKEPQRSRRCGEQKGKGVDAQRVINGHMEKSRHNGATNFPRLEKRWWENRKVGRVGAQTRKSYREIVEGSRSAPDANPTIPLPRVLKPK